MPYPNSIIAGAPKCGTTSLFHYLSSHPEVCASNIKETRYLLDEDYVLFNKKRNYFKDGIKGYKQFFNHCRIDQTKIIIEATPPYLYQKLPLKVLKDLPIKPKIIFILRNPADRIFSLYNFARNNMAVLDSKISFPQYIHFIETKDSRLNDKPILESAIEASKYINYLKKWYYIFDNKMIILLFEKLKSDPLDFMAKLCNFLEIDCDFYRKYIFPIKNKSRNLRNKDIEVIKRRFLKKTQLRYYLKSLWWLRPLGPLAEFSSSAYNYLNSYKTEFVRKEDYVDTFKLLDHEFEPYNEELSTFFDLDLSLWQNRR